MSREHRAEALSVRSILHPSTVAVIGASRRRDSIGSQLLDRLRRPASPAAPPGQPQRRTLRRRTAYPSVAGRAGAGRPRRRRRARRRGARRRRRVRRGGGESLLVVSSGFAEEGRTGRRRQAELLRRARGAGMRVIGPNSFGLINNDPAVRLNASLAPTLPPHGRVGLFAQSGALGIAVLASAARRSLGISTFARPATGPTSPATTSCSTGSTTSPPTPSASTSSRSATRASSPASPATWP